MEIMVNILTDGFLARYTVKHEVDGIYIAKLVDASDNTTHKYPRKIFLHKDDGGWKTDHHAKEIGLLIGKKIDEELRGGGESSLITEFN